MGKQTNKQKKQANKTKKPHLSASLHLCLLCSLKSYPLVIKKQTFLFAKSLHPYVTNATNKVKNKSMAGRETVCKERNNCLWMKWRSNGQSEEFLLDLYYSKGLGEFENLRVPANSKVGAEKISKKSQTWNKMEKLMNLKNRVKSIC